ncbi:MAG: hypothetical protein WCB31_11475 [Nitrososphaeraceae archaeon]
MMTPDLYESESLNVYQNISVLFLICNYVVLYYPRRDNILEISSEPVLDNLKRCWHQTSCIV